MPNWIVSVLIFLLGLMAKEIVSDLYKTAKLNWPRMQFYLLLAVAIGAFVFGFYLYTFHSPVTAEDLRVMLLMGALVSASLATAVMTVLGRVVEAWTTHEK